MEKRPCRQNMGLYAKDCCNKLQNPELPPRRRLGLIPPLTRAAVAVAAAVAFAQAVAAYL